MNSSIRVFVLRLKTMGWSQSESVLVDWVFAISISEDRWGCERIVSPCSSHIQSNPFGNVHALANKSHVQFVNENVTPAAVIDIAQDMNPLGFSKFVIVLSVLRFANHFEERLVYGPPLLGKGGWFSPTLRNRDRSGWNGTTVSSFVHWSWFCIKRGNLMRD